MLKIKDQKGKLVGVLKDDDTEPLMVVKSECTCTKDECKCEEEEEGEEEDADVD